jgi:putative transcriptional regulator
MKANHGRFIVAGLLLVAACTARAQDLGVPILLVAAPGTQGAYSRTVLLVVLGTDGHAGFILNRPSDVKLASVLPGNPLAAKAAIPVRFGGPLGSKAVYAMVRHDPGEGAKRLFGDIYMTSGASTMERIVEQTPQDARFFAGMAVWLPGNLEDEIESGEWLVAHPDESLVFNADLDAMWDELVARVGKDSAHVAARHRQ